MNKIKDYLGNFNSSHGKNMETENFGTIVSHNEALKFLLMDRKVTSFDVEISTTRETEHVLTLCVPSHAVSIGFLEDDQTTCNTKK